ncbi:hypothetical protein EDD86DRAFT_203744 [Gorgonomyces haynaldii]|nr:hypothetical protein EDD86DRAFT_203744 [Gorgonomyces haynaldii]
MQLVRSVSDRRAKIDQGLIDFFIASQTIDTRHLASLGEILVFQELLELDELRDNGVLDDLGCICGIKSRLLDLVATKEWRLFRLSSDEFIQSFNHEINTIFWESDVGLQTHLESFKIVTDQVLDLSKTLLVVVVVSLVLNFLVAGQDHWNTGKSKVGHWNFRFPARESELQISGKCLDGLEILLVLLRELGLVIAFGLSQDRFDVQDLLVCNLLGHSHE